MSEIEESAGWSFTFGFDFGLGTAIYIDDSLVYSTTEDIWYFRKNNKNFK